MASRGESLRTRQLRDVLEGAQSELAVRLLSGSLKGEIFLLEPESPFIVGASPEASLQLPDTSVSRLHLELTARGPRVHARDLGSTNGSFFEDSRFEVLDLGPGAVVRLGETELQIVARQDADGLPPSEARSFGGLLGKSVGMRTVFAVLERAAKTDATVLITGETGTGKEVVAESIHKSSARRDGPFVVVDCGSIPANLVESELFGHVKGAYTNALNDRTGAFASASGGTIFLDEIGELPVEMQPRLLRVLETQRIKPVGANEYKKVDVRVIAATNRELEQLVQERRFRSDLYYRLAVIRVRLPALRERREDVPLLARHFAKSLGEKHQKRLELTPELIASLISHDWPGNVRELRNVIEQATTLSETSLSLALELARPGGLSAGKVVSATGALGLEVFYDLKFREARRRAIAAFELGYVRHAVEEAEGNVTKAAEKAGLHRNMVHRILAREKDDLPEDDD